MKTILLLFLFLFASSQQWPGLSQQEAVYRILDNSKLTIHGTSNVNKFACDCTQKFPEGKVIAQATGTPGFVDVRNAVLKISAKSLDCKRKEINKDMLKTLKAEKYPDILIKLIQLQFPSDIQKVKIGNVAALTAFVDITMGGVTKRTPLKLHAKKQSESQFIINGEHTLSLGDFGLKPPDILWGMIRINDAMQLMIDLKMSID